MATRSCIYCGETLAFDETNRGWCFNAECSAGRLRIKELPELKKAQLTGVGNPRTDGKLWKEHIGWSATK